MPLPATGSMWPARADMGVTVFEHILFILGLSFSMLLMVRARTERYYQYASQHDDLTGLYNRRALFERGSVLHAQAMNTGRPLAALMLDLDWFKSINDRYGHRMGDEVLTLFAKLLLEMAPEHGICARLGGEEFLMLVPDTTQKGARLLADTIHDRLPETIASLPPECSVSIGISINLDTDTSLDCLIARADEALYAAKTAGRNCTRTWTLTSAEAQIAQ